MLPPKIKCKKKIIVFSIVKEEKKKTQSDIEHMYRIKNNVIEEIQYRGAINYARNSFSTDDSGLWIDTILSYIGEGYCRLETN